MSVAIVDYGSGNLHSAHKGLRARRARGGARARGQRSPRDPEAVARAEHIVLPGVGAFADCRRGLDAVPGMVEALEEAVRRRGRPFLGICVGMQLMATRGLEHEIVAGPRLDSRRRRGDPARRSGLENPAHGLEHAATSLRAASRCWRASRPARAACTPISSIRSSSIRPSAADVVATADYGGPITAMVARDNIVGTQFHPEKSQTLGLALIANFLKWRP